MDQQHHHSCREGAKVPLLPKVAEEIWHASQVLSKYYFCTIESVLTSCITAWYGNGSVHDRKALQRVVKKVQYVTVVVFPPIQDIYTKWCLRKPNSIIKDPATSCSLPYYRVDLSTCTDSLHLSTHTHLDIQCLQKVFTPLDFFHILLLQPAF